MEKNDEIFQFSIIKSQFDYKKKFNIILTAVSFKQEKKKRKKKTTANISYQSYD